MDLLDVREAIVASLAERLPKAVTVSGIRGRFDLRELETYTQRCPAVMVGVLSATGIDDDQELQPRLKCAAYVLTKNGRSGRADEAGLRLASSLLHAMRRGPLAPDCQAPTGLGFNNLYSTSFGEEGVWLAAVTWQQATPLTELTDDALEEFLRVHATYDLAPADGKAEASNLFPVRPTEPLSEPTP
ncbi:MAG: hypothetical protein NTZ11_10685 [Gammaproteobacteria bacterium]|nr:hypothetical protein [Gammaproteobacteria bacterium]